MRKSDVDLAVVRQIACRAFPGAESLPITRTEEGVSTQVYRLDRNGATYYLRLAEEADASLEPEVLVHSLLRRRGVRVPEVVYVEDFNEDLGRAVMITTEIPGCSLAVCHDGVDVPAIVIEAGRDLAEINGLRVAGFGWIKRDRPAPPRLEGEFQSQRVFALQHWQADLDRLRGTFLSLDEVRAIERTLARYDHWLDGGDARLALGDFDASHIFHQNGCYTGIIDFGEIRGASRFYDLGHFAVHDGEVVPTLLLPYLLEGYRAATPLPLAHEQRIQLEGLLIGIRALGRSVDKPRTIYQDHLAGAIRRCLRSLAG